MTDDPTLEDALDGLNAAARYCEDAGLEELASEASALYQAVGEQAPDADWDESADTPEVDMTAVAAEIAQENVDLKNDLRDLVDQWEDGMAPDQACARELRDVLDEYE